LNSPEKKAKIEKSIVTNMETLCAPLVDVPLVNVKIRGSGAMRFQVRPANVFHLVNASDQEAC
jgi:hypothetical protein